MNGWRRFITILVVVALVVAALYLLRRRGGDEGISVTFLGGAMEVGGSCTLVSGGGTSFLVDCGAFGDAGYLAALVADADNHARLDSERRFVHFLAVDADMSVDHELAAG